jgi:hypothetical protein
MPTCDARETHRIRIDAPPAIVFAALETADLGGPLAKAVLGLRRLPEVLARGAPGLRALRHDARRPLTLDALTRAGFGRVARTPPASLVLGIEGRFWRLVPPVRPVSAAGAGQPIAAGWARGLWSFELREVAPGRTELTTETRVRCGDDASRRRFRRYWWVVRPGSGLLRRLLLRAVRRAAERGAATPARSARAS